MFLDKGNEDIKIHVAKCSKNFTDYDWLLISQMLLLNCKEDLIPPQLPTVLIDQSIGVG